MINPRPGKVISPRGSQRTIPSSPMAMGTPPTSRATAGGAERKASGSQECNGQMPVFRAKPANTSETYKPDACDWAIVWRTASNPMSLVVAATINKASNKSRSATIMKPR